MLIVTDVSFYQYKYTDDSLREISRTIDFGKMREKTPAVILRAGQNLWKDITFDISRKNAKDAGLFHGSYWFYDSRADPKKQAALWVDVLNGDTGELPLWCDFEDRYGGKWNRWQDWYDFIEYLKEALPTKEIGIYTAYYYWLEHTVAKAIPKASLNYFKNYPLWVAHYGVRIPLVPAPWDDWTLWQYTDNGDGLAYGVQSLNIDLNYFNGDEEAFRARFRLGDVKQPSPRVEAFEVKAVYPNKVIDYKEIK